MTLDEQMVPEADAARERVLEAEHQLERARVDFHHEIRRLHAAGGSMREIAERFRLSHQRVHQVVGAGGDSDRGKKAMLVDRIKDRVRDWGGFARFDRDARAVVERAQEEAGRLGHCQVGTEHVLLGLLGGDDEQIAGRVLRDAGITPERAREDIVSHVGSGEPVARSSSLRFTPRAKKVLELSLREAIALKHNYIGTEHILLGLLRESSGLGTRVLKGLGAEPARLRDDVQALL